MTLSDRDKRIVVFLPGMALLVGYLVWFWSTGKQAAVAQAETALERAEKGVPSDHHLRSHQMELAQRSVETNRKKQEVAAANRRLLDCLVCVDPNCRTERMHKLTTLFAQYGLTVIEHGDAEGGKDKVPPAADALRKRLPNAATMQLHGIRFVARYQDVLRAASALAGERALAIPVSLTMKESSSYSEWHEWLMLVWV